MNISGKKKEGNVLKQCNNIQIYIGKHEYY